MEDNGKPIWNTSQENYLVGSVYGVGFALDSKSFPPLKNIIKMCK